MTLSEAKNGKSYKVIAIDGGRGVVANLYSLGIYPGSIVIVSNKGFFGGPLKISVDDGTKVALGRGISEKVLVEEI